MVLRIEDTDAARNRPEWVQGILDAMAWLGVGPGEYEGPLLQSDYKPIIATPLSRLRALARQYPRLALAHIPYPHPNILIFDDTWVNSGFDWLSFRDQPTHTYRPRKARSCAIRRMWTRGTTTMPS